MVNHHFFTTIDPTHPFHTQESQFTSFLRNEIGVVQLSQLRRWVGGKRPHENVENKKGTPSGGFCQFCWGNWLTFCFFFIIFVGCIECQKLESLRCFYRHVSITGMISILNQYALKTALMLCEVARLLLQCRSGFVSASCGHSYHLLEVIHRLFGISTTTLLLTKWSNLKLRNVTSKRFPESKGKAGSCVFFVGFFPWDI